MTREEMNKVFHKMLSETDLSVRGNMTAQMCEACHMAIRLNEAWEKVKDEIRERLKAIEEIKTMGVFLESPQAIERRKMTYEQCLEFINKHLGEVEE